MRKAIFYPILCVALVLTLAIFLIVKRNIETNNNFGYENSQTDNTNKNGNYTNIKPGDKQNCDNDTSSGSDDNNSSSDDSETKTDNQENSSSDKDNDDSNISADDDNKDTNKTENDEDKGTTTVDVKDDDVNTGEDTDDTNKESEDKNDNDSKLDDNKTGGDNTGDKSDDNNKTDENDENSDDDNKTDEKEEHNDDGNKTEDSKDEGNNNEDDETKDDSSIIVPSKEYKIVLPNLINDTLTITRKSYSVNYQITYGDVEYIDQYIKVEIVEDENSIAEITSNNPPLINLIFKNKGSVKLKITCISHPEIYKIITIVYK